MQHEWAVLMRIGGIAPPKTKRAARDVQEDEAEFSPQRMRELPMLTSVRSLLAATVLAGSVLASAPALAQDETVSDITVSGNVAVVTDYRFRGVSLTAGDPAIQGGISISHSSGFYVGTWGSSLEDSPVYGEMELDLYGGWSGEVSDGVGLDVGVLYYAYPSSDVGGGDVWEFYGKVKPTIGPVGLTFGVAYAPDQESLGDTDNLYLNADASVGIPQTPLTLTAHVGYTDGALGPDLLAGGTDDRRFDYSIGA